MNRSPAKAKACEGCGKRDATTCIGGAKASATGSWEIWLCDECAGPMPAEMTEKQWQAWAAEQPEFAITSEQLKEIEKRFGLDT